MDSRVGSGGPVPNNLRFKQCILSRAHGALLHRSLELLTLTPARRSGDAVRPMMWCYKHGVGTRDADWKGPMRMPDGYMRAPPDKSLP